ncbi:MAG: hypothetical protein A3E85_04390 [Gammaproteobacteria bacterium RIFCSPHIGHO2_12_FULL_45_12]|nr:MAG: hypothetical protein A3E85_04390 [Gammaproteobacteria bacterium RIFCSPHIGHO2_12_FULL_45_12]
MDMIPVLRPKLAGYDKIKPYLERMDESRWYANFGPLLNEFEARVASCLHVTPDMLTTAGNGTLMLTTILNALEIPKGSYCIMPSWTFIATAAATVSAGLTPLFADVDLRSQALDPIYLLEIINKIPKPIGAIIAVAPFGAPIDIDKWDNFTDRTGIPVVIDAAAGFDTMSQANLMSAGRSPCMLSLHATKVFGIGEGGIAISTNTSLIRLIKTLTGYGFNQDREAVKPGINAKLSEYSAAVGLAGMDMLEDTMAAWKATINHYITLLNHYKIEHLLSREFATSTCNVILPNMNDVIADKLKAQNIDTRKWWLMGCHQHLAYRHFPKLSSLPSTEWLGKSVLGLPLSTDLSQNQIERIVTQLHQNMLACSESVSNVA